MELERPLNLDGKECRCGASVGIAAMGGAEIRTEELLVNADIALDRAKKQGRGSHEFFSDDIQRDVVRYKGIADGVLAGLERGEFLPYYQPQISADSMRIVGVEALARWHHPALGVLAPGDFLKVAEDLGVVATLDRAILETAISDLARWRGAGLNVPKLSVNVSARRLLERDLIRSVGQLQLPQGGISFELLETVFLDEVNDTIAWNIDMLKEMGIEIELDDFGSGHASIISLVKLGPDAIKIDRQLVSTITEDRKRRGLLQLDHRDGPLARDAHHRRGGRDRRPGRAAARARLRRPAGLSFRSPHERSGVRELPVALEPASRDGSAAPERLTYAFFGVDLRCEGKNDIVRAETQDFGGRDRECRISRRHSAKPSP